MDCSCWVRFPCQGCLILDLFPTMEFCPLFLSMSASRCSSTCKQISRRQQSNHIPISTGLDVAPSCVCIVDCLKPLHIACTGCDCFGCQRVIVATLQRSGELCALGSWTIAAQNGACMVIRVFRIKSRNGHPSLITALSGLACCLLLFKHAQNAEF